MTEAGFLDALWEARAIAIVRTGDREVAERAMDAAVRGGFRFVEFTWAVPGVLDLVAAFARRRTPAGEPLVVGAGTVLEVDDARRAAQAGARFIVSPVTDDAVLAAAAASGVAALPGAVTPTELLRAHRAGAPLQKLFPAPPPDDVRAMLGPMPFLRPVPTSGVTAENAASYLEAGAFAVGAVRPIFAAADLAEGRWDRVEARAREFLEAARRARRPGRRPV